MTDELDIAVHFTQDPETDFITITLTGTKEAFDNDVFTDSFVDRMLFALTGRSSETLN